MRRYPLDALLAATGLTEAALSRLVGLSGTTLVRAREHGLTADAADRYAVRAGFAPVNVWLDYGLVECARPGCSTLFAPNDKRHRCCKRACSKAMWARTERGKASMRAAHTRWKDSVPEYSRLIDRVTGERWREANRDRKRAADRARYQAKRQEPDVKKRLKKERVRLVRAEMLMHLAMTADRWADEVTDDDQGATRPFAEWPADDPLRKLCEAYNVTAADLGAVLRDLAEQLQRRADRSGYAETLTDLEDIAS